MKKMIMVVFLILIAFNLFGVEFTVHEREGNIQKIECTEELRCDSITFLMSDGTEMTTQYVGFRVGNYDMDNKFDIHMQFSSDIYIVEVISYEVSTY